ncbi:MAG: SET domain-containing protein-lysine N-methyltransferase [Hyphomicrobiales bacterium]|nr:SET domain-containing protein-lysine N-methyltransferase [Hyphomicrobiales bacterium]OQW82346.1 MAG: hypothetical protein BVN31_08190 [Proteobacteria bacterium ST_bin15]
MKICVLQPSYQRTELLADYARNDPPRDLSALVPEWQFTHVFLDKATVYRQLKALKRDSFDIFVNLCEGHLEWDVPSIDVIHALDALGLPYTGPSADLYEPRKGALKIIARYSNVATPGFVRASRLEDVKRAGELLAFPLFLKPNEGGDSFGIESDNLVNDQIALIAKGAALLAAFDDILIEQFIGGREFSVLVAADPQSPGMPRAFAPIEFVFPPGECFKSYALKNTEFHPELNIAVTDETLATQLKDAARRIFLAFGAKGYCRLDFRLDAHGTAHVLDANFTCSVFYPDGFHGTADYILAHDGFGAAAFLRLIIADGLARHRSRRKSYRVRDNGLAGLGIEATRALAPGDIVFKGEERAQRLATRRHVADKWNDSDQRLFAQYAYPLSDEVYILWSEDWNDWAPQNHSCDPNTGYDGLDVIALRPIAEGEELTLDYATFCNEAAEGFTCGCGAVSCRGFVTGTAGNSVDRREASRRSPGK